MEFPFRTCLHLRGIRGTDMKNKSVLALVIDLYTLTENHGDWFPDGVHPNVEGYEKIAEYIYDVLKEKL